MHHHEPAASSATTQRPIEGRVDEIARGARSLVEPGHARTVGLEALRRLQGPLASLRVLLEGARGSDRSGHFFSERALEEVERAEQAAHDLIAWTLPRHLQSTRATLGEMIQSLRETLSPSDRRRTHFVVESPNARLVCDARLLVETVERSLRHAYREVGAHPLEIMVHAHASAGEATLSFIHTDASEDGSPNDGNSSSSDTPRDADQEASAAPRCPSLAEALLRMDVDRAGGRLAAHHAEGHRCFVMTLPLAHAAETTEASQ